MKQTALTRKKPMARGQFKPAAPKTAGEPKPPKSVKCGVKGCGVRFVPEKPFVKWCGPDHGEVIAQAKLAKIKAAQSAVSKRAKKAERALDKERAEALKTLPELLAEAQKEFNRYIRLRDHDQPCICCGKWPKKAFLTGGEWDAGHYRSVGSAGHLRFHPDNCHRQLKQCNRDGAGRAVDYRLGLIRRKGLACVEALESDNAIHKWTHDEVRGIRDTYRAKANQLEKELKQCK